MCEQNLVEYHVLQHPENGEAADVRARDDQGAQEVTICVVFPRCVGVIANERRKTQADEHHYPERQHFFAKMRTAGLSPHPIAIQVERRHRSDARRHKSRPLTIHLQPGVAKNQHYLRYANGND